MKSATDCAEDFRERVIMVTILGSIFAMEINTCT